MMLLVFTVFDSAARRFLEPFCADTPEVACRMFRTLVNREGHQFNRFPEDYTLFQIGEFDGELGTLKSLSAPHPLGVAITFRDGPRLEKVANA